MPALLGFIRTAISVVFVSVVVWCSLTVPLGRRTFADHVDRIGQTREAEELIDGARARMRPLLEETKNRFLGEYVEAPTYLPAGEPGGRADARTRAPAKVVADDPAAKGPAKASPATKGPAKSDPAKSAPAESDPAKSAPAKSAPAKSDPATASIYARGHDRPEEPALPRRRRRE